MSTNFSFKVIRTLFISTAGGLIGLVASIIIARILGPEGRGVYALLVKTMIILTAVCQFGLPEVMLSQMRKGRRKPGAIAANALFVVLFGTGLSAVGLWFGFPYLQETILNGVSERLLWIAFWILPFGLGFVFFGRMIQLDGQVETYNRLQLLRSALALGILIALLFVWYSPVEAAVMSLIISYLLVLLVSLYLVRRSVAVERWAIHRGLLREVLKGGMKVQWGMLALIVSQQLGLFLLNIFSDLETVGWFAVALGITNYLMMLSTSIQTVLQSWMPGAEVAEGRMADRVVAVARHTMIIQCGFALALAVSGWVLIRVLYGQDFTPAYLPMLLLLPAVPVRGIRQIISSYFNYQKRLGLPSLSTVLAAVVNGGLALILIPQAGMAGAAVATTTGQIASLIFLLAFFRRMTGQSVWALTPTSGDFHYYFHTLGEAVRQRTL